MGSERATFEVVSRTLAVVGTIISKMQIHPFTKKPQSNGRCLNIISISLGWTDNHAYKAFGVIKVKSVVLQECQGNGSKILLEALVL